MIATPMMRLFMMLLSLLEKEGFAILLLGTSRRARQLVVLPSHFPSSEIWEAVLSKVSTKLLILHGALGEISNSRPSEFEIRGRPCFYQ